MNRLLRSATLATFLSSPAFAIEPIPGSITYHGQPTRLLKSPVGSQVSNEFWYDGYRYSESYTIQPDRSLKLTNRTILSGR